VAAIAHIVVGDFELGLTTSILIGALPAVYVGARLSSKAPDGVIRPMLVLVLLASALKLLGISTGLLGVILLAVILLGSSLWGAADAAAHPQATWEAVGLKRRDWIRWLLSGALVGVGTAVAVTYFAKVRPRLAAAATLDEASPLRVPAPASQPTQGGV
jgi:hypothetical protein